MNVNVVLTDDNLGLYAIQNSTTQEFIEKGFHSEKKAISFAKKQKWTVESVDGDTVTLMNGQVLQKVTVEEIVTKALLRPKNSYTGFKMGEAFELEDSSWFGLQKKELFETPQLLLGHFGGAVRYTICLDENSEEETVEYMKDAFEELSQDEGETIWMEVTK